MRRIQIYLDEATDEALQAEAARSGRSKASLIRECVAVRYGGPAGGAADPFDALIGSVDVDPAPVDDVVYAPPRGARAASAEGKDRTRRRSAR